MAYCIFYNYFGEFLNINQMPCEICTDSIILWIADLTATVNKTELAFLSPWKVAKSSIPSKCNFLLNLFCQSELPLRGCRDSVGGQAGGKGCISYSAPCSLETPNLPDSCHVTYDWLLFSSVKHRGCTQPGESTRASQLSSLFTCWSHVLPVSLCESCLCAGCHAAHSSREEAMVCPSSSRPAVGAQGPARQPMSLAGYRCSP